ncbi:DUF2474 domain-containing protein [Bordetella genomosp. 13]|uniref:DUF2474 domain-containing protein n=1 Tax=Bordetella genomosp. 13 TaxID=463040 RepID=A0A1W6ZE18_9BORD|nr:DUF2474 domain-containing protein [Bordetella genomosp. 13]ARP95557.1 DUF2474 domain-containing protein [Bordetella genomosp. 13]
MQPTDPPTERKWARRMLWLVLIWAASVAGLGALAYLLRLAMGAAGMSS